VATAASDPKTCREAPIITGKPGGIGRRLILIFLVFAAVGLVLGEVALAEPADITKAKNEADALREQIDELSHQLDAAVEEYNYAKAKLAETKDAAEKNQLHLTKAEADLEVANAALAERLVEVYKQGHLGVLDALVGASSFSDVVNYLDQMERLSEQDAEIVAQVSTYQEDVEARKVELAQQMEDEKVLAAQAETAKTKVEEQLAANEKALAGKKAQIAQLEKEEAERQARLAAEAKRKAEEARKKAEAEAAAKAKAAAEAKTQTKAKVSTVSPAKDVSVSVPDSASGSAVVSIAMQYLGVRYVWAGESPSGGFDCSGFVKYVYKQLGINLPHSSRMQYPIGQPVSRANLRPGDLVFFYNPISHVAIYIGDGQMIHAAGSGKDVRISDVWTKNYYGACRIIL
jgi:cell wall-associated NlpC family hydrolase